MSTINTTNLKNPSSGSNNVVLNADGTSTLTPSNIIKSGTAVASTSGTSIDFTGIPSWVKRVTVMFSGVSLNGSSSFLVQIGAGSVTTSGYVSCTIASFSGSPYNVVLSSTAGFVAYGGASGSAYSGAITLLNITSNTWVNSGVISTTPAGPFNCTTAGNIALGGTLDRVRITTVNGTDTFDAGTINILYEG